MEISATVKNAKNVHFASVCSNQNSRSIPIPCKETGRGSAVNGGELLLLALATCYCNDLYREADRIGITVDDVEVKASATFPGIGLAATDIRYTVSVSSSASREEISELLRLTDAVAEVHNTIRAGASVALEQ